MSCRADHRHAGRLQEAPHRGDRRGALALLEPPQRLIGERGRKLDVDHITADVQLDRKAAVAEHVDHPMVARQHLGAEDTDGVLLRGRRELAEHDRRDAVPLPLVGDDERHLGPLGVDPDVGAMADYGLLGPARGDQRVAVRVVHIDRPLRDPVHARRAEEPQTHRLERERLEEHAHRGRIAGSDGPYA